MKRVPGGAIRAAFLRRRRRWRRRLNVAVRAGFLRVLGRVLNVVRGRMLDVVIGNLLISTHNLLHELDWLGQRACGKEDEGRPTGKPVGDHGGKGRRD